MDNDTKRKLTIWSCRAACQDKTIRTVTGIYHGRDCILIARPWLWLLHEEVLARSLRHLQRVLHFAISVADYRELGGAWSGKVQVSGKLITALIGDTRNVVYAHTARLARLGYIRNAPRNGGNQQSKSTIYIPPVNIVTGFPMLAATNEWPLDFIVGLEPVQKLWELPARHLVHFPTAIGRVATLSPEEEAAPAFFEAGDQGLGPDPAGASETRP